MTILLFTFEFPPQIGGAGNYTADLAKGLGEMDHEVVVLAPNPGGSDENPDLGQDYTVERFFLPDHRVLRVMKGIYILLHYLLKVRPDVTHVTDSGAHRPASILTFFPIVQYFITIHGTEITDHFSKGGLIGKLYEWGLSRFYQSANKIICVSNSTFKYVQNELPSLELDATVVQNGINPHRFSSPDEGEIKELRTRLNLEENVLLTVSRLIPEKGIDTVLEALSRITEEDFSVSYIIGGEGPDRDRLENLATTMGLEESVHFTGRISQSDLGKYYSASDIFIMISRPGDRFEGFGLVYLEANVFGKPVLAGDTGGAAEAVEDGINGLLVDPREVEEVRKGILQLIENPDLSNRLGKEGLKRVRRSYSHTRMAKETFEAYQKPH